MIILSPSGLFFRPKTLRQAGVFPLNAPCFILFLTNLIRFDTAIRTIKGNF